MAHPPCGLTEPLSASLQGLWARRALPPADRLQGGFLQAKRSAVRAYLDGQRQDLSAGSLVQQAERSCDVLLLTIHQDGGDVLQDLVIH